MDKDAYIKHLEKENAKLKKRVEELERLLWMNSRNSSKPPNRHPRIRPECPSYFQSVGVKNATTRASSSFIPNGLVT